MKLVHAGILLALVGLGACSSKNGDCAATESSCSDGCTNLDTDRDNCGACGHACGDGLVCSQSTCVEGCDGTETRCNGVCVDTTTDVANCGMCTNACTSDQTCTGGSCGCAPSDVTCSNVCTDPQKDDNHCGASGDCTGSNAGVRCGTNEGCLNGTCASALIYRGSLPASTGVWNYGGVAGIPGANAECAAHWAGTAICSYTQLTAAQAKAELVNAADYNGTAVGDWWIDDPTADGTTRCNFSQSGGPNIPWSYGTSHLGNVGRYTTLTPATGAVSPVHTGNIVQPGVGTGLCSDPRFVACCTITPAP